MPSSCLETTEVSPSRGGEGLGGGPGRGRGAVGLGPGSVPPAWAAEWVSQALCAGEVCFSSDGGTVCASAWPCRPESPALCPRLWRSATCFQACLLLGRKRGHTSHPCGLRWAQSILRGPQALASAAWAAGCVSLGQLVGSGLGLLVSPWYNLMAVPGSRPRLLRVGMFWNVLECRAACFLYCAQALIGPLIASQMN